MWTRIDLDNVSGRVQAVSAPDDRQMIAVHTADGLFGVWFSRSATVLRIADGLQGFDQTAGVLRVQGNPFPMIGDVNGRRYSRPLPQIAPHGDTLHVEPAGRTVHILVTAADGTTVFELDDRPAADRWLAAGFSPDGRYLIIADAWDVRLYRHTPERGKQKPVWAAKGVPAEQGGLLAAVAAAPDDDLPRLVYADWLQENGDTARADLIRFQCEHAKAVRRDDPYPGEGHIERLLQSHGDRWAAEYPAIRGVKWSGFWRGFPCVTAGASTLARHAAKVWAAAPVESVVLSKLTADAIVALMNCKHLDRLRILELSGLIVMDAVPPPPPVPGGPIRPRRRPDTVPPSTFFHLLNCLSGVWWLAFGGTSSLGTGGCRSIAQAHGMPELEILGLRWCEVGDDGAAELLTRGALPKLRSLDLRGNEFGEAVPPKLRKRFPNVVF
jgi:uncharacterized protein (TIGR02996 family)